jgi:hypothetical protein
MKFLAYRAASYTSGKSLTLIFQEFNTQEELEKFLQKQTEISTIKVYAAQELIARIHLEKKEQDDGQT